jgi:hypothetical protein
MCARIYNKETEPLQNLPAAHGSLSKSSFNIFGNMCSVQTQQFYLLVVQSTAYFGQFDHQVIYKNKKENTHICSYTAVGAFLFILVKYRDVGHVS